MVDKTPSTLTLLEIIINSICRLSTVIEIKTCSVIDKEHIVQKT
jgi:hypothetical protein